MTSYSQYLDNKLVELLTIGDEAAFTEIYNRYWAKLFSVASNKVKDLSVAEELVQDIFLDLWKRRKEITISGELAAYLAVAMKYKVINARLKLDRARQFVQQASKFSNTDDSTRQNLSFYELKGRLEVLVNKLPENYKLIYRLSREAGLSQKEISQHLEITEKAVEGRLSRAIKFLQSGLGRMPIFNIFF